VLALERVLGSVVAGGLGLVGAVIGIGGSLFLLRPLGTLLFGVTLYDVQTYAIVVVLLGVIAGRVLPARSLRRSHRAADGAPTRVGPRDRRRNFSSCADEPLRKSSHTPPSTFALA